VALPVLGMLGQVGGARGSGAGAGGRRGPVDVGIFSPDNRWEWDGNEWRPLDPLPLAERPATAPSTPGRPAWVPPPAEELDYGHTATGDLPDPVQHLPELYSFKTTWLAAGTGWVAARRLEWHLMPSAGIVRVGIAPPTPVTSFLRGVASRGYDIAPPALVLEDRAGRQVAMPLTRLRSQMLRFVESQVPATAQVGPAAARYFASGELPGRWGRLFRRLRPAAD
jgi:hypothetical protein